MDSPNLKMLVMLLPKLPLVVRETIMHILGISEPSKYLDLHSALVISVLRSMIEPSASRPQSISSVQKLTLKDPGVKGRLWVSTYASPPPPETSIRDELMQALGDLRGSRLEGAQITAPDLISVEAEWTGYRPAASPKESLPSVSNKELYGKMMEDCSQPTTILYLHGGAFYVCDPITHRPVTSKLAKLTGGRCYSVRYRLSPQHPFPAALLDALLSYMTLLYPPPDAYHEPVKPQHLAIAGDR
jgi:acetyl esterase/lipase